MSQGAGAGPAARRRPPLAVGFVFTNSTVCESPANLMTIAVMRPMEARGRATAIRKTRPASNASHPPSYASDGDRAGRLFHNAGTWAYEPRDGRGVS